MNKTIIKAPFVKLSSLETLFIEMTAQNCNLRCKYCYIDFKEKKVKDFISVDKVKQSLSTIDKTNLKFIHLTGAEPMFHPDFNLILRMCLKVCSVVVHTNAHSINDKKARFLRKVEEENNLGNEIIFMISIDHYDEKENDIYRGRGSYRKAIHAIQSLSKYEFNPILSIVNHKNIDEIELKNGFTRAFSSFGFEMTDINFKIRPLLQKELYLDIPNDVSFQNLNLDCSKSRTLTINGVFSCPLLSNDNRGRSGLDFNDYSDKSYIETAYCTQCAVYNNCIFSLQL